MKKILIIALVSSLAAFAACSNSSDTGTTNTATTNTTTPSATANGNAGTTTTSPAATTGDDIPASVRAALPDAQSITKQHKDLTPAQISSIEQETGGKVPDTDHHSYLAFSTSGGARRQTGAATVVEVNGKQMVVVYESRNGLPFIKEVRAEGVAQTFLDQFKGKGHDDKFQIGGDLKAQGVDEATAKAIASAIRVDATTMQTLYGSAHSH
ncbi:MAG: hypothetical protein H0V88_04050 [Pyrinomonadaceae bacterium]|nr:hypothetical protein [Pyrinomonadaceae bacterium]